MVETNGSADDNSKSDWEMVNKFTPKTADGRETKVLAVDGGNVSVLGSDVLDELFLGSKLVGLNRRVSNLLTLNMETKLELTMSSNFSLKDLYSGVFV